VDQELENKIFFGNRSIIFMRTYVCIFAGVGYNMKNQNVCSYEVFMMRFSLYGEGEGVLGEGKDSLWACFSADIITDASISARELGIRPGMRVKVAQSLVPQLILCPEVQSSEAMKSVWEALWTFSPWLETIPKQAFFLQIPGSVPPIREVRDLLLNMNTILSEQQRLRIGLAENLFLAKALVVWSRVESVRGAQYYKVGRQQWIVSPVLAEWGATRKMPGDTGEWIGHMPISCLWLLPQSTRTALLKLGIERLRDLQSVSLSHLKKHFGKESLQWYRFLEQKWGSSVRINYPPQAHRETWQAEGGEAMDIRNGGALLQELTKTLAYRLKKDGLGALKVGMTWETDTGPGCFERIAKKPANEFEFVLSVIQPGVEQWLGERLEKLTVYAEEIRPLVAIQSSFTVHRGAFIPTEEIDKKDLTQLIYQVNRKFPKGLQIGLRPNFRELRLQAVTRSIPLDMSNA
jgi:hypothetical protein